MCARFVSFHFIRILYWDSVFKKILPPVKKKRLGQSYQLLPPSLPPPRLPSPLFRQLPAAAPSEWVQSLPRQRVEKKLLRGLWELSGLFVWTRAERARCLGLVWFDRPCGWSAGVQPKPSFFHPHRFPSSPSHADAQSISPVQANVQPVDGLLLASRSFYKTLPKSCPGLLREWERYLNDPSNVATGGYFAVFSTCRSQLNTL